MIAARRRGRGAATLSGAGVVLLFAACGGEAIDLPAVELGRSSHFRYYARADDRVPVTVLDLLEAHWTEMSTFFGLDPMTTINYYLFDSDEDVVQNGPCKGVRACAGWSVYTSRPFDEHELIHTYFAPLGSAPPIIAEGVASAISCFEFLSPAGGPPPDISWQKAASTVHADGEDWGQSRLVRYLIRHHGPEAFSRFYRHTEYTLDPALFALQFERFWGESIDAVWADATAAHAAPNYLDVDMCPCSSATLPIDGTPIPIVGLYGAFSPPRQFTLAAESDVAVSLEALGGTAIRNCWDQDYKRQMLQPDLPAPPATVLLRLPEGHYYLQALPAGTTPGSISMQPGSWLAADCASVETFSVDQTFVGKLEILAPGTASHARLSVAGPRAATVSSSFSGLSLCPACDSPSTDCITVAPSTSANLTLSGPYVVRLDSGQQVSVSFQ